MDPMELTAEEQELICLVHEDQPIAIEELLRLCTIRLMLSDEEAWSCFASLLEREMLTLEDGRVTSRVSQEDLEKIMLERAVERAEAQAAQRRRDSRRARPASQETRAAPAGKAKQPAPPAGQDAPMEGALHVLGAETTQPGASPSARSDGAAADETAPAERWAEFVEDRTGPDEEEDFEEAAPRWRLPVLIGAAVLVVLAAVLIPLLIRTLNHTYPWSQTVGGRQVTIEQAPADKAQRAAEDWIIQYAKGKTSAGRPVFRAATVHAMETYEVQAGWRQALPHGQADRDQAVGLADAVVFADVEAEEGNETVSYQYRIYLQGDEKAGYHLYSTRSCPAAWAEPYYEETFAAGGGTYTLSLCGEETEFGHRLRAAFLTHGSEKRLLYLTEESNTVYAEQHRLTDLNGDGAPDILLDTQYATQLCYLYDESAGYTLFDPLSGGQVVSSDALPGAVLFTDLSDERTPSYLYRWDGPAQLTELARMEAGAAADGPRRWTYYAGGAAVREYEENGGAVLEGELAENQRTLFGQYMTYAYWDELVLETARANGCLALPEEKSEEDGWEPFTLRESLPNWDLYLYVSPSGLLMADKEGRIQVLPCAFQGLSRSPVAFDLTGSGEMDLLLPFNSLGAALLLARWNGQDWDLTGLDLGGVEAEFAQHAALRRQGRSFTLTYDGSHGRASARWSGGSALEDGESLSLDLDEYYLSFGGGAAVSLRMPVQVDHEDGTVRDTGLFYTVDLRVPLQGLPEIVSCRLS